MCFHFRPKKENTGELSESGASVVKYGLKAEKIFMQVHYLKVSVVSWFLLRLCYEYDKDFSLLDIRKFIASALIFLQGYFLLRSLARTIGEVSYLASLRKFVIRFHGQLVLSQVLCLGLFLTFWKNKQPKLLDWLPKSSLLIVM